MATKTVKKTTAKKTPKKTTSVAPISQSKSAQVKSTNRKLTTKNKIIIIIGLVIIALGVLAYVFRGLFIAATVNGQPITRIQLIQELEKKSGKQTLDSLVTKDLILQEMKKKNITVSDAEVNAEVKKIEDALSKQGRTLQDALSQQGLSRADLMDQLKIQKMIEKLFAKDITVSDKEVTAYMEANKDSLPTGQDEATLKTSIKDQIRQQKLTAKFQAWLADLQKKSQVQYFVQF